MDLNEYQRRASVFAEYPNVGSNLNYPIVGLGNEAGEVLGTWKKELRGDPDPLGDRPNKLVDEVGDTLWYIQQICTELGISLNEVAKWNLKKLEERQARGTIKGSGDNR